MKKTDLVLQDLKGFANIQTNLSNDLKKKSSSQDLCKPLNKQHSSKQKLHKTHAITKVKG